MSYDLLIIGGGASGMAAAISAANTNAALQIAIVEKQGRVGKKLLVTGNGRCNLSNQNADVSHYHGENPRFVLSALKQMDVPQTMAFFEGLGVLTRTLENGRLYPYCMLASGVLDALRMALSAKGIQTICDFCCEALKRTENGFCVLASDGRRLFAKRVIVACGSVAGIKNETGAYRLMTELGHHQTKLYPALVQLKTDGKTASMQGVKFDGIACLYRNGKKEQEASGEILFTEYGLSGPPIFDLSRAASIGTAHGEHMEIGLKLMPTLTYEEICAHLFLRNRHVMLEQFLNGLFHKLVAIRLLKEITDHKLTEEATVLDDGAIYRLADLIVDWRFTVTGTNPFSMAQVAAGGIKTDEFFPNSMESRLVPGIYCTGEMLDIDGDCGGYNLQWAWSSGTVAGTNAAKSLQKEETI